MHNDHSRRRAPTIIVVAITLFMLLLCGIPMFLHPGTAYVGVHFHNNPGFVKPFQIEVERGSPAYRAGLRSGDVVTCLTYGEKMLLFWKESGNYVAPYLPGSRIALCDTRAGTTRRIVFTADPRPPFAPLYGSDVLAGVRLLEYAALLILAAVMVIGRPGLMTWTFFAYAITSSPTTLDINYLSISNNLAEAVNVFNLVTVVGGGLMMMFCAMVPLDRPPAGWRSAVFWLGLAIGAVGFVLSSLPLLFSNILVLLDPNNIYGTVVAVMIVAILVARVLTTQAQERARFAWAALGIALLIIVDFIRQSPIFSPDVRVALSMLTIVPPALLAYAVLKRHVIDVTFAISRTLVYAIITTILVAIIGGVDWATTAYLHEARVALALDAAVTIAVAFALNRLHKWIEHSVESVLFRDKYRAQKYLRRIGHSLIEAQSEETVDRVVVRDPFQRLHLSASALFRAGDGRYVLCASDDPKTTVPPVIENDHDLVRLLRLERSHVNLSDLAFRHSGIAIPIFQGRDLNAFVVYGMHRDGTALDPDELDTLERLCESAAQAYTLIENARYRAASSGERQSR